ncbi:MAG TPA: GNAT family N-acetyltransferase [Thermomicrobiales bacterium]|nr:GNAT family N-acetyltransferase [Thermomicrobiales bacterium]
MLYPDLVLRDVHVGDADALAHILIMSNEGAFRGRVPDHCLTFTEAESGANWRRTLNEGLPREDFLVVAEPPGLAPVGYAWGGPRDDDPAYRGELRQIAVLPSAQNQGIGRRLVRYVADRLAAQGIHSMRVEVLRINPNRGFYERLGAHVLAEHDYDWDGIVLPMCVYGWANTQSLQAPGTG